MPASTMTATRSLRKNPRRLFGGGATTAPAGAVFSWDIVMASGRVLVVGRRGGGDRLVARLGAEAAAERLDQLDGGVDLLRAECGHALLGLEQLLAHDQRFEVAADTGLVALLRKVVRLLRGVLRALLRRDLRA